MNEIEKSEKKHKFYTRFQIGHTVCYVIYYLYSTIDVRKSLNLWHTNKSG